MRASNQRRSAMTVSTPAAAALAFLVLVFLGFARVLFRP
jgi:hypothetical protein